MKHESPDVAEARTRKAEFLGKSKIEQGLESFSLYRVAPISRLNRLQPRSYRDTRTNIPQLSRALFFTTQKDMAMEYALLKGKTRLLRIRGVDFLEDLKRSGETFDCLLLDQEAIVTYQRIVNGEIKDLETIDGFIRANTKPVSDVSLRELRRAAEVIVILPEGDHSLPFQKGHARVTPIMEERASDEYHPGGYHGTKVRVANKLEGRQERERAKYDALRVELDDITTRSGAARRKLSAIPFQKTHGAPYAELLAQIDALDTREGELRLKLMDEPIGGFAYSNPVKKRTPRQEERRTAIEESMASE